MQEFRKKVLDQGAIGNPILALAQEGLAPAEFKKQIVHAFAPYFANYDVLDQFAIDLLAAEIVNLAKVRSHPLAQQAFDHARALYAAAENVDAEASHKSFAAAEPYAAAGRSEFWSGYYLLPSPDTLSLPEFKHDAFRTLGLLLEGCLQPLLRELLNQQRIAAGQGVAYESLMRLTFGGIVGELHDATKVEIYAPPPWHIRLNQWRNMAQHYRTAVRDDQIVGWYGEAGKEKSVQLSRADLTLVKRACVAVFDGVRLARAIRGIDRIRDVKAFLPDVADRPEVAMLSFVTAVATQGFEATNAEVSASIAEVWLRDHRSEDRRSRMIHASQFVHALWAHTQAANAVVHYCGADGEVLASFSATTTDCQLFADGEISLEVYVSRMTFNILGKDVPSP